MSFSEACTEDIQLMLRMRSCLGLQSKVADPERTHWCRRTKALLFLVKRVQPRLLLTFGNSARFVFSAMAETVSTQEVRLPILYISRQSILCRAVECPAELSSMLKLSMAKRKQNVEDACAEVRSGQYDIHRHMPLCQKYVFIWARDVLDGHPHFMAQ